MQNGKITRKAKAVKNLMLNRLYTSGAGEKAIVDAFHRLYYDASIWGKTLDSTYFLGIPTQKCPLDLWIYQEIIYRTRPDVIVETGTNQGGSAMFMAWVCDAMRRGRIITVDISAAGTPKHKRITYIKGSSTDEDVVAKVRSMIEPGERVMVILDSDHTEQHVTNELRVYSGMVSKGCYLIVEDTDINGHPVKPEFGPGPMESVVKFMKNNAKFRTDKDMEKFYMTCNPDGYLIKVR